MVSFPSISIHQQFAQLGIDADHATLEQKQPKATYEMKRVPPKLQIESPREICKSTRARHGMR